MDRISQVSMEDLKALPWALLGLARGVGEVILGPIVESQAERLKKVSQAAIYYYTSGEKIV